ncbi:MAG: S-layer homology domain-containing protein [Oscillospiraceae bacterium]|nr:S-layer homology domain-containing protein [Oscillospiraceae bacterium]
MKKRIGSLLLILALCFTLLPTAALASDGAWDGSIDTAFAGGTGTESDPYQIADGAQLAYLASEVNKGQPYENSYFVLTADIDLANHDWTPIGNSFSDALFGGTDYHLFAGNLDGKGHTIFNISIGTENAPLESDVFGLFGATGGKISNLNLDDITIYGTAKNVSGYIIGLAGALAGSASGPIENCHVANLSMTMNTPDSGTAAAYWIGGLVGALDGSQHIEECSASGTIKERSGKGSIGGLIGELGKAAKITYSHADVALDVKPDYYGGANVGGLIGKGNGENDPETVISNCYATGNVTGGAYSGGFAGSLWGLNIKNCYATGDVTGAFASMATFAGTDAPAAYAYGSVTNCYTTGKVVGTASSTYAFMQQDATARSPITNCYFADANSAIKNSNETAISKTPEEMQTEGFKDALNASSPTNGWIFREGETPLCGAEPADYSVVDAALGKIPADLTAYTDESIETLSAATEAVIRGKVIAKQAEVDTMAKAIEDAIAALVKKPSSSGGFSSGSFFPSYPVNTPDKTENGTVTVSTKNATSGSTVTITVKPDDGFKLDELTVIDKNGNELKLTDKGNGKYTFTMPASKVEVNAAFVKEVETSPFGDVSTSVYYYEAVKWAQEKGITGGIGNGLFGPNQPCTRAQIVTFLWRATGSPVVNYAMNMSDVPEGSYYAEAVRWALSEGITTGTTENTFSPDSECTRAQAVAFLFRYAASEAVTLQELVSGFSDADSVPGYALPAMNWALAEEIVQGNGSKLMPNDSCTRAQIVTFLFRAYQGK